MENYVITFKKEAVHFKTIYISIDNETIIKAINIQTKDRHIFNNIFEFYDKCPRIIMDDMWTFILHLDEEKMKNLSSDLFISIFYKGFIRLCFE